jgi:hypothetical protein
LNPRNDPKETIMRTSPAFIALAVAGAALIGSAAPAVARPSGASGTSGASGPVATAALNALKTDGAAAISARESQLTKLATELSSAPSCDTSGKIAGIIAADEPALQALGTKLAGDTTVAQARIDHQAIFDTYRVYLVVTPQAYVSAACGHIQRAATTLTTDEGKLKARVAAAAAAGADMSSADTALADMSSKLSAAQTESNDAYSSLSGIVPDQGVKSVETSNAAAVIAAHGDLVSARADLVGAVSDAQTAIANLKAAAGTTTTTAGATTTTTA